VNNIEHGLPFMPLSDASTLGASPDSNADLVHYFSRYCMYGLGRMRMRLGGGFSHVAKERALVTLGS
jgi:hypothetical protein